MNTSRLRWAVPLLAVFVAACGSAPVVEPPPPPVTVTVSLAAASDVNPDVDGRASPLVVRVYELTDGSAFAAADFFALWGQEQQVLAAAPAKRQEFQLVPGAAATTTLKLDPGVQQIGIAAAFRDIRNSNWRVVLPVNQDPQGPRAINVSVRAEGKNINAQIETAQAAGAGQ
jgi:type VI secretion system protein VasD